MKYFWLIRHAKSSQTASDAGDFERTLSRRGHKDGARMAIYFGKIAANRLHRPQWLITSAATRAQETSRYVAEGFEVPNDHKIVEQALYLAQPQQLLAALQETPADIDCVALVAHNPGLTWLVNALARDDQQIDNLPTLGCALFSSETADWAQLNQAELISIMTPKKLTTDS